MIDTTINGVINFELKPTQCSKEQRFEIRPNASMSTKCAWASFLIIIFLSIAVMARFALLGAWMVIPFTLIEVIFVGRIFWLVIRNNKCIETIICKNDELKVIQQGHKKHKEWIFHPYWVRVFLHSRNHAWYPDRLLIQSHGKSVEIGACLTETERTSLAKVLSDVLHQSKIK